MQEDVLKLTEGVSMDPQTESHFSLVTSLKYALGKHYHEFYEFFLVTGGKTIHNVNNSKQKLCKGSLVFIRPCDVHYYESDGESDCQFINVPYTGKAVSDAFNYLGKAFREERLLQPDMPPTVELSPLETIRLEKRLKRLFTMTLENKQQVRTELRGILIEVLTQYFPNCLRSNDEIIPLWLDALLEKMQDKEVFTEGLPAVYELSGKSPMHINRTFKRYLNMKPTEYLNGMRMNYARNLLTNTDMKILDIAMETGYGNLSHFYHLFKEHFNTSPAAYRQANRRTLV